MTTIGRRRRDDPEGTACLPRLLKYSSLNRTVAGHNTRWSGCFGNHRSKSGDDLRVYLYRPPLLHYAHANRRRRQTGKLILQSFQLLPIGFQAERAGERGHRILDIDDRIAGADRFAGKMDQHEPGFFAVRKANMDELPGWVDGGTGFDAHRRVALLAIPFADMVAGVFVRQADLALNGMQKIDPVGRITANRGRSVEKLLLLAGESQPSEILYHLIPLSNSRFTDAIFHRFVHSHRRLAAEPNLCRCIRNSEFHGDIRTSTTGIQSKSTALA